MPLESDTGHNIWEHKRTKCVYISNRGCSIHTSFDEEKGQFSPYPELCKKGKIINNNIFIDDILYVTEWRGYLSSQIQEPDG